MKKIPVFYDNRMVVDIIFESPSPRKPKEVAEEWRSRYSHDIEFKPVQALKVEDFYLAHKPSHVNEILSLQKANGLDTKDRELADSLVWTNGSFLSAAREALENQKVAVSPTSGFHHAGYEQAWGFCTFNGLLISARYLFLTGKVNRIGILDCDYHFGDGSVDIIEHFNLQDDIVHITGRRDYERKSWKFMEALPELLNRFKNCDILFYQAGADAHIDDPLGGFLNNEELRWRDFMVFDYCEKNHIPLVWNLAGGYQEEMLMVNGENVRSIQKVLDIHNATMEECIKVYL